MTRTLRITLLAALALALMAPAAGAQSATGDLVVVNDLPSGGLPLSFVAINAALGEDVGIGAGAIPPGGATLRQSLAAGDGWVVTAYDEADGEELDQVDARASARFSVTHGATTTVTARLRDDGAVVLILSGTPQAPAPAETGTPAIRVPTRIDTGGGGTAGVPQGMSRPGNLSGG